MPRKVTDAIVSAFLAGKPAKQANTSTDGNSFYLHGNEIAKMKNGELWITNAGWATRTTYERLNGLPGVSIGVKGGKTMLNGVPWDGAWIKIGKPNAMESTLREDSSGKITKENLIDYIMRFEDGDLDKTETLNLFSHLIKTGMVNQLQGSYGRTAQTLINKGLIDRNGNIKGSDVGESIVVENKVKSILRKIIKEEIVKVIGKKKP